MFRMGIPDLEKRTAILSFFGLKPHDCKFAYQAAKEGVNEEFISIT